VLGWRCGCLGAGNRLGVADSSVSQRRVGCVGYVVGWISAL